MKGFISDNFLLENKTSQRLYHDYAKDLPIIDYHNHLPPDEIANNKKYSNITELWLKGDHYKWRAMRILGIKEKYITGNASDYEKFQKWSYTVPYTLRNPLYHWTHLELKRYFDLDVPLNLDTASMVYGHTNDLLDKPEFYVQGLLSKMNVEVVCTTDDPLDNLSAHKKMANSNSGIGLLPAFRPDGVIDIDKDCFVDYLNTLSQISGVKIKDLESLLEAIKTRIEYFHENGCRLSDHGLPHLYNEDYKDADINNILKSSLKGSSVSRGDALKYKSAILVYLGRMYHDKNWAMQLHLGPIRDTNKGLLTRVGKDVGVDSIGDYQHAESLAGFLNRLDETDQLPKTVIYNSNPADNDVFATMAGNFNQEDIKGKVQFGAAWWFLDQKDGITKQINSLSNMGLLSTSVGMLTDSRSFLSFPRHEYYRKVLCNIFGNDIEKGELPNDIPWVGKIIQDISYYNTKSFFDFPVMAKKEIVK